MTFFSVHSFSFSLISCYLLHHDRGRVNMLRDLVSLDGQVLFRILRLQILWLLESFLLSLQHRERDHGHLGLEGRLGLICCW